MSIAEAPFVDGEKNTQPILRYRDTGEGEIYGNFFQTDSGTFAYCELTGGHGLRENIPAARKFFIADGHATFRINDKEFSVEPGSIVVVPQGANFEFSAVGSEPVKFFVDMGFQMDLNTLSTPPVSK